MSYPMTRYEDARQRNNLRCVSLMAAFDKSYGMLMLNAAVTMKTYNAKHGDGHNIRDTVSAIIGMCVFLDEKCSSEDKYEIRKNTGIEIGRDGIKIDGGLDSDALWRPGSGGISKTQMFSKNCHNKPEELFNTRDLPSNIEMYARELVQRLRHVEEFVKRLPWLVSFASGVSERIARKIDMSTDGTENLLNELRNIGYEARREQGS